MCDVYGEACFLKHVYKWARLFKEDWNSIQEDKLSRPTMASTPEMVESVNERILANRRLQ